MDRIHPIAFHQQWAKPKTGSDGLKWAEQTFNGRVGLKGRLRANQAKLDKLGTFQKLLEVVDEKLSQWRPFGSLQSVDQLLDLG